MASNVMLSNLTAGADCDNTLGPSAYDCSGRFDFTLLFEQSILAIVPSVLLLLVSPLRAVQLSKQSQKVLQHRLSALKLAAGVAFAALQLALLILWARSPEVSTRVSIAASVLGFVDALVLLTLSYTEHLRSVRPSTVVSLYLTFSILFDAVQCRTLWLLHAPPTLAAVFSAMLAVKVAMLCLETQGKTKILLSAWQHLGPESRSGIIARAFFWWLNGLLLKGFSATLSMSALYKTDDELQSQGRLQMLQKSWQKRRGTGRYALFFATLSATKAALLVTVTPRLLLIGFKFSQPFLINRVITYVEGDRGANQRDIAYGLIGATVLIYLGSALTTGFYQHKLFRSITMIRGSLVSIICHHTVDLNAATVAGPATLTLTSTDVDRICMSLEALHEIWGNAIEIGIATYLLARQLGVGSIGPAIVVIVCTVSMSFMSRYMVPAQKVWNVAIQERVNKTSKLLGSMKEAKMLGLVESLLDVVQGMRNSEMQLSASYRKFIVFLNLLGNIPEQLGPVVTFGISLLASRITPSMSFSVATVFTSLSIMGLLMEPLGKLVSTLPAFISSLACFDRIQKFLEEEGHHSAAASGEQGGAITSQASGTNIELSNMGKRWDSDEVVALEAVSFAVEPGQAPILRDVNFRARTSTFTIVIGKVACGKSILLQGILGELHSTGRVKTSSTGAAYCAQNTWLTNNTIRDNIRGRVSADEAWYETVIRACALDIDFEQLPDGDHSLIGSKGLSLSGGQKQRISLARALYSRKGVYVIDDVLSGLDWTTQSRVWDRVFSPRGLLRQQGATVILATHTLNYLEDADNILVLAEGGIAQQGTFTELKDSPYFRSLALEESKHADQITDTPASSQTHRLSRKAEAASEEVNKRGGGGDMSLYRYYFSSMGWQWCMALLFFKIIAQFSAIFPQIWLRLWTEANASGAEVETGRYYGIYAMLGIIAELTMAVDIWCMFVIVLTKSAKRLHLILLQTVMRAPLSFFVSTDTGDLVNRFSQDMSLVDRELPIGLFTTATGIMHCIGSSILIFIGAKYLSTVIPVAIIGLYALQSFYLRTSRQMRHLDLQAKAPLYTHLMETVDGLATIRAFGWQAEVREDALGLLDESQRPYYLLYCIQRWLNLMLDIFVTITAVLLVSFGVLMPDTTSAGGIAVALFNVLSFNQILANVINSWTLLETSLGAIARLKDFEASTPRELAPLDPQEPPALWPSEGKLEFRDIVASYSPTAKPVLSNLSLLIHPGEKVAICGRTGSGKSSLLLTLFRLLDLDAGSIILDGIDISRVAQGTVRQRLITIPQEPLVFPGTLRSNLTVETALKPSDAEIIAALEKVDLWDALSLHGGLDIDMADVTLSQGQKQLLYLARAILRKGSNNVLVLDEAMSAVDQHTEELMVRVLETEFVKHTVISVAHKLNTVRKFDKIVVLEAGVIVETGAPEDLLRKEGSKFHSLWHRQG